MMTNLPSLTTETLWAILNNELPDDTVNQLVWHTLGYRYVSHNEAVSHNKAVSQHEAKSDRPAVEEPPSNSAESGSSASDNTDDMEPTATIEWCTEQVDSIWREKYPEPPNFIESRPATVQLTRAIPQENKQLLKTLLGFKGYSVDQLVPRLTRRATMANWLLSEMRIRGLV